MPKEILIKKIIYKFNELPESSQNEAINKLWDINVDHKWWDFDGLLDLSEEEMKASKISLQEYPPSGLFSYTNLYFDIDTNFSQYNSIEFKELQVNNEEVFRKFLKIPKALWEKITYTFHGSTTSISFLYSDTQQEITQAKENILNRAEEIFDHKVREAWSDLWRTYQYLTSREAIVETILANDYWFNLDGNIENDF